VLHPTPLHHRVEASHFFYFLGHILGSTYVGDCLLEINLLSRDDWLVVSVVLNVPRHEVLHGHFILGNLNIVCQLAILVIVLEVGSGFVYHFTVVDLEGKTVAEPFCKLDHDKELVSLARILLHVPNRVHVHRHGDPVRKVAHDARDLTISVATWAEGDPDLRDLLLTLL